MEILLFDMDGVLVKPRAYHRALQETVRLAGIATGFGEVQLAEDQIAEFEALGISSEWHSSALCMAAMVLQVKRGIANGDGNLPSNVLNLVDLFEAISAQPLHGSALQRGQAAIEWLAATYNLSANLVNGLVVDSESIQSSPTLNWFQELILGSEYFAKIYHKQPQFKTASYLKLYDEPQLSERSAEQVLKWAESPGQGAAIMTNRPSRGPSDFSGMPDAELGSSLVGMASLPIVGKGELLWLVEYTGLGIENFSKPSWKHALAAILVASGWSVEESLKLVGDPQVKQRTPMLEHLHNSRVAVFEDTPSGLIAAQEICDLLGKLGLQLTIQKIGVAEGSAKRTALSALGAQVYPDINQALASLDYFGAFPGN
jgi:phosphoglycolate phosphatase-like HAD superfamily hydrolase